LEIFRDISLESVDVSNILNDLGLAERADKEYDAAERDLCEALRIAKHIGYVDGIASCTGNLAELALDREQWAEAETLAREALFMAKEIGRQELIAFDCHNLAKALLKQHYSAQESVAALTEAATLVQCAVDIFTVLRYKDLQEAQQTLEMIAGEQMKNEK
jgi:hypothetical protein